MNATDGTITLLLVFSLSSSSSSSQEFFLQRFGFPSNLQSTKLIYIRVAGKKKYFLKTEENKNTSWILKEKLELRTATNNKMNNHQGKLEIKVNFEQSDLKDRDPFLDFSMRANGTEPVRLFPDKFLQKNTEFGHQLLFFLSIKIKLGKE